MASAASIQNKLLIKIFNKFGSTMNVYTYNGSTKNDYGDATASYGSAVSEVTVPYNQIASRSWEPFGDLNEGEIDIIFKHTAVILIDDKVVVSGVDYKVIRKEDYPYDNDNLAILVRVAKIL